MDCLQITEKTTALGILKTHDDKHLRQLFICIYELFHDDFLKWVKSKYMNTRYKDKLLDDAKDAFQNGVYTFYLKAQKEEFNIKGTLRTTIFSFGLLQLMAYFKKDRYEYGSEDFLKCFELYFQDNLLELERQEFLNEQEEYLLEAMTRLTEKQRHILYLKFFSKLSSKEIANKLGIGAGNVDNETTKAYKALRQIINIKVNNRWR